MGNAETSVRESRSQLVNRFLRLRTVLLAGATVVAVSLFAVSGAAAWPGLTPVSGSPFAAAPVGTRSVAFSPTGRFLATANDVSFFDGSVSVFSVNAGGALTPVSGSPFATDDFNPNSVAYSPDGTLLATADIGTADRGSVSVFSVGTDGTLTRVSGSPFDTGSGGAYAVAFSPNGRLLATGNSNNSTISVFSVGSGGALTPVSGSPFPAGANPGSVAFSPDGRLLASANNGERTLSVFRVSSSGRLTAASGSPVAVAGGPGSVAFDPTGRLLASANGLANTVSVFSVRSGGVLVPVSGSPFTNTPGTFPVSVAFSPDGLLATANSNYPNVGTVSVFSVGAHGALTAVKGSPLLAESPFSVAFSPRGGLLAAGNIDEGTVSVFSYRLECRHPHITARCIASTRVHRRDGGG